MNLNFSSRRADSLFVEVESDDINKDLRPLLGIFMDGSTYPKEHPLNGALKVSDKLSIEPLSMNI